MVASITTFAFDGANAVHVDVEVQITDGGVQPIFSIVGLADKAVGESRERVRAAFASIGLGVPPKRVIVNLSPADLPKEGSHFDAPIALAILAEMGVLPADALQGMACIGELSLDGSFLKVAGALPAAIAANQEGLRLICPVESANEAAWAGGIALGFANLMAFINHARGQNVVMPAVAGEIEDDAILADLSEVKGQHQAKRALEVAAAGGHNLLLCGPPGAGKSMLASRLPSILPKLSPKELLEVSMIHSVAGLLAKGKLNRTRPFRAPHHSASMAALTGGGLKAKPGEISLAHNGVLFLDELPEFGVQALDALRQPLETGEVVVARANRHITYPARFQLVAAMNPCRCGAAAGRTCGKAPKCMASYQSRISGPLLDRIDLQLDIPEVSLTDLSRKSTEETSAQVGARVLVARQIQEQRYEKENLQTANNAALPAALIEKYIALDDLSQSLLNKAAQTLKLSARAYHRIMKVARTIADLDASESVKRVHMAEALAYRRTDPFETNQATSNDASKFWGNN